jgi:hypothetical protein
VQTVLKKDGTGVNVRRWAIEFNPRANAVIKCEQRFGEGPIDKARHVHTSYFLKPILEAATRKTF